MIIACDQSDQAIFIGYGQTPQAIQVRPCSSIEDAVALLQSTEKDAEKILLTEHFPPIEDFLKDVTKIGRLPRLEAVYWFYEENLARSDCLVVSIGLTSCSGAVVKDGQLVDQGKADGELALREIWEEYVDNNDPLRRAVDAYVREKNSDATEEIFKGFREALSGKVVQKPIPLYPQISLNRAIRPLKAFLERLDPHGGIKALILTDWAALGNLPELMKEEGYIVYTSDDSPFLNSVKGLVVWGLKQEVHEEYENIERRQDQTDRIHGPGEETEPDQILIECVDCGKKNRLSAQASKKRPICGACRKPLPPVLFQQAREALLSGEYNRAIKWLDEISAQDKSNRLYQLMRLLATIREYKSIQGYEKKVGEVRNWADLADAEEPWVKQILTLAGKEYLEKGDIEPAEENLDAAYKIEPSSEASDLLAKVKKEKGDWALRKGDLKQALSYYHEAATKDPANQDYPRYLAQVRKLIDTQRVKSRRLTLAFLGLVVISLIAWFGRNGAATSGNPGGEIRGLKEQIKELKQNNERLQQGLATQKKEFEAELSAKDTEIERLKGQVTEGARKEEKWREELERTKRLASIEREARFRSEEELAQSRQTIAPLQERIGKLEAEFKRRDEAASVLRPGRYRVIRETNLLSAPNKNATVVSRLSSGIILRVVEILDGTWLRVISTMGNDPGYLHRDDAVLLSPESSRP